jgi:hypothetical protein
MRLILILIVIIAIFAVVQSKRHNCEFGADGWFDCVKDNTVKEFSVRQLDSEAARTSA